MKKRWRPTKGDFCYNVTARIWQRCRFHSRTMSKFITYQLENHCLRYEPKSIAMSFISSKRIGSGLGSKRHNTCVYAAMGKIMKLSKGKFETNFVLFPSGFQSERDELCKRMISVSIVLYIESAVFC